MFSTETNIQSGARNRIRRRPKISSTEFDPSQVERSNRRIRHGTDVFRTGIQKESVGSVTERNVFRRGPIGSLPTDSCRIS